MTTFMSRMLLALGALCFVPLLLQAQSTESVLHTGVDVGMCGGALFAPDDPVRQRAFSTLMADPAARARAAARSKSFSTSRRLQTVGDVETFYVLNRVSQSFDEIPSVLRSEGRLARIWVDVRDTGRVSSTVISQLTRGLDSATGSTSRNPSKGIVENNIEVFGETPKTYEIEGKTDFLMTDIQDGMSGGGYVAGYFSPYDQSRDYGSNARNILYIDSRQGLASGVQSLLNTLAHEFQHLIHHSTNPNSEAFFNEGCSEVASILCGYKGRGNSGYMANTNVDFLDWNYGQTQLLLADYERAMTFHYYLFDQFGEAFLREFTTVRTSGFSRVNQALQRLGVSDNHQSILKGFAVANTVLSGLNDDRYRYDVRLSTATPKASATYDTLLAPTGSVTLQPYATSYFHLKSPSTVSVRFTSSRTFRVMAIVYRANVASEVVEMEGNTTYVLNGDRTSNRIVFCVINMSGSSAAVGWNANESPAGVDDEGSEVGVADVRIAPQPATGGLFSVALMLPRSGPVQMELFDVAGRLVRRPLEKTWTDAGQMIFDVDVRDLASGSYMLRVALPGTVVSRRVTLY